MISSNSSANVKRSKAPTCLFAPGTMDRPGRTTPPWPAISGAYGMPTVRLTTYTATTATVPHTATLNAASLIGFRYNRYANAPWATAKKAKNSPDNAHHV